MCSVQTPSSLKNKLYKAPLIIRPPGQSVPCSAEEEQHTARHANDRLRQDAPQKKLAASLAPACPVSPDAIPVRTMERPAIPARHGGSRSPGPRICPFSSLPRLPRLFPPFFLTEQKSMPPRSPSFPQSVPSWPCHRLGTASPPFPRFSPLSGTTDLGPLPNFPRIYHFSRIIPLHFIFFLMGTTDLASLPRFTLLHFPLFFLLSLSRFPLSETTDLGLLSHFPCLPHFSLVSPSFRDHLLGSPSPFSCSSPRFPHFLPLFISFSLSEGPPSWGRSPLSFPFFVCLLPLAV